MIGPNGIHPETDLFFQYANRYAVLAYGRSFLEEPK